LTDRNAHSPLDSNKRPNTPKKTKTIEIKKKLSSSPNTKNEKEITFSPLLTKTGIERRISNIIIENPEEKLEVTNKINQEEIEKNNNSNQIKIENNISEKKPENKKIIEGKKIDLNSNLESNWNNIIRYYYN
jgi:hypothetical protein